MCNSALDSDSTADLVSWVVSLGAPRHRQPRLIGHSLRHFVPVKRGWHAQQQQQQQGAHRFGAFQHTSRQARNGIAASRHTFINGTVIMCTIFCFVHVRFHRQNVHVIKLVGVVLIPERKFKGQRRKCACLNRLPTDCSSIRMVCARVPSCMFACHAVC